MIKNKFYLLFTFALILLGCSNDDNNSVNDDQLDPEPVTAFTPCENGMAGIYPCNGYDLLGSISLSEFDAAAGNDVWGWMDPDTNKEYALMGLDNGTAFVDISDTENMIYLGKLPTASVSDAWRDIKVYQNHVFIVADNSKGDDSHGVQVFDLTRLRNVIDPPIIFDGDPHQSDFGRAHNIVINQNSGFAYVVGTNRGDQYSGGVHFINVQDPKNPISAGGYGDNGYTHDAQVITYHGPDTDYAGAEIFIGANENQVAIVNVTDKDNPMGISTFGYSNLAYTHQGWFTEDHRYLILGDELDEVNFGFDSRTLVFDLSDLDNPILHTSFSGQTTAIDHNGYVKGDQYFLANYRAGVRVLDISGIANKNIFEEGFFDTFPSNNSAGFDGVWSVYPYFSSGKIIVSDINSGLFVIKRSE